MLAGAVGREDLDAEREQLAGEGARCRRGSRPRAGLAPGIHPPDPGRARPPERGSTGGSGVRQGRSTAARLTVEYSAAAWHTRPLRTSRRAPATPRPPRRHTRRHRPARRSQTVTLPALGVPVPPVQQLQLPRPLLPDLDRLAGPARRRSSSSTTSGRGSSATTRRTSTCTSGSSGRASSRSAWCSSMPSSSSTSLRPGDDPDRRGCAPALGPVRPLPADVRGVRAQARQGSATSRARSTPTRRPRSGPRPATPVRSSRRRRAALNGCEAGPVPMEIRRFGVGHRRPEGPAGTRGVRARSSTATPGG